MASETVQANVVVKENPEEIAGAGMEESPIKEDEPSVEKMSTSTSSTDAEAESGETDQKNKFKVKIRNWNSLAYWKWIANDDKCGICRTAFEGCCADCKIPGDDCPLVWGVCSHCFHMHCIMKWLASQQTTQHTQQCPMCRQVFEWKSNET